MAARLAATKLRHLTTTSKPCNPTFTTTILKTPATKPPDTTTLNTIALREQLYIKLHHVIKNFTYTSHDAAFNLSFIDCSGKQRIPQWHNNKYFALSPKIAESVFYNKTYISVEIQIVYPFSVL